MDEIKDSREETEEILRATQLIQLKMLKYLDKICKKNNMKYYLEFFMLYPIKKEKRMTKIYLNS